MYVHRNIYACMYMHRYTYIYIYTYMCMYIYIYIHTYFYISYIRMHMYTHTYRVMPNPNPNVLFVVFISQRLKQHLPGIVAEIYQLMPPKINLTNATTFVTGLV